MYIKRLKTPLFCPFLLPGNSKGLGARYYNIPIFCCKSLMMYGLEKVYSLQPSNKSSVDNEYVMNPTHKKTILLPLFQPENRQAF